MNTLSRRNQLVPQIVFVDGLSGSGKTALLMAVSSLERVEMAKFEHTYEYVCALRYLERIEPDAASTLMRLCADVSCYNSMISREVNYRPNDISSVLRSPKKSVYEQRLSMPDGKDVQERIDKERPILHIMTHGALGIAEPLFTAFEGRMSFFEIVRHPLDLLTAWSNYIDRYGRDALEFTVTFDWNGHDLPWFAHGWEDAYLSCSRIDRAIRAVDFFNRRRRDVLKSLSSRQSSRVMEIPFERFVMDPWPYIDSMCSMLNTNRTARTEEVLRDQNIPRRISSDIPDHPAFRKYGYTPLENASSAEEGRRERWASIEKEASPDVLKILKGLCDYYEDVHLGGGLDD